MSELDIAVFYAINGGAATAHWLVVAAVWASKGLPVLAAAALLLACIAGPRQQQRQWRRMLLLCAASLLLTWCMVHGIRASMPLPRPAALGLGIQWISHGIRPGFPSMHAAGSMALVAALCFAGAWRYALVALLPALAVVWSRVFLGVHFPSDVVAGMATGIAGAALVAGTVWVLMRLRLRAQHMPARAAKPAP